MYIIPTITINDGISVFFTLCLITPKMDFFKLSISNARNTKTEIFERFKISIKGLICIIFIEY